MPGVNHLLVPATTGEVAEYGSLRDLAVSPRIPQAIVDWQTEYHGAALATVGHALADVLGEVLIPGSYAEADLHPWGTHPDLDPLWSGSAVRFVHDAGLATENWLRQREIELRSDVLVKGQHHSGSSASDAFLDAVRPQLIIATSRDFPQQERISDEWAERVQARGIKLFRQDETGAVEMEFGKDNWSARSYITGEVFRSDNR